MKKIKILDKSVSELIAAGEVIERPASIIKELLENSIDAKATKIKVEIKNGGVTYIKVTDNGIGIGREDVPTAFLRHATSKVNTAIDLDHILTLGFRGEALSSICAVSKIELITRTKDEVDGTRCIISEDQKGVIEDIGTAVGTTIIIRDLFFNVPARMKFLKKDVTEGNAVASIIDRLALSHPEIAFTFIRDGQEKLSTFGDGNLLSTIYCIFGKDFASKMLPLKYKDNNFYVKGYISNPAESRMSRSMQNFFVNSRYVRSKTCGIALEEAYKSFIVQGRFPACVLNIEIPSNFIDINVHPAKLEIRFANEKEIYNLIYIAVKNCILSYAHNPIIKIANIQKDIKNLNSNNIKFIEQENNSIKKNNEIFSASTSFKEKEQYFKTGNISHQSVEKHNYNQKDGHFMPFEDFNTVISKLNIPKKEDNKQIKIEKKYQLNIIKDDKDQIKKLEASIDEINLFDTKAHGNLVGEVFSSYLIIEQKDQIIFLDKHAVHERIIYDNIINGTTKENRQVLLTPEIINLGIDEYQTAKENVKIFEDIGFLIEDFGDKAIVVREIPLELNRLDIVDIINGIIDNIISNKNNIIPHSMEKIYFTIACKAAIKSGDKNTVWELDKLLEILDKYSDIKNCPHGRPISFTLKKKEMDKQFLR